MPDKMDVLPLKTFLGKGTHQNLLGEKKYEKRTS